MPTTSTQPTDLRHLRMLARADDLPARDQAIALAAAEDDTPAAQPTVIIARTDDHGPTAAWLTRAGLADSVLL